MSKSTFDELLAKREQREADKLKVGLLSLPGGVSLEARMPGDKAVLELYGELTAASDAQAALLCGNHALYACCPQLQDKALQTALDCAADPMTVVDALFSVAEQDQLGGQALRFLGLIPSAAPADADQDETQTDPGLETVKNGSPATPS